MQIAIASAVVIACALAGLSWWHGRSSRGAKQAAATAAAAQDPGYLYATEISTNKLEKEDIALDLGEGVKMEFVWIKEVNAWIGKYEVTNQEFRRHSPLYNSGDFEGQDLNGDRYPVVRLKLRVGVMAYLEWINGLCLDQLPPGHRARLLNEREIAAILRCGDDREYPWGSEWPPPEGWNYNGEESVGRIPKIEGHRDKWPAACPVDESGRNDWGLYGVGDNVMEWTAGRAHRRGETWLTDAYDLLGASWYFGGKDHLRCSYRTRLRSKYAPCYVGFRLAIGR